jgi:hypothetical protein
VIVEALVRGVRIRLQLKTAKTVTHSVSDAFLIGVLRNEPTLQRNHVGTLHTRSHAGQQYSPCQCHQYKCEFHAHGCAGLDHLS